MTITIIEGIEWVRAKAQLFFGRDTPDAMHLLDYMIADVIVLGRGDCVIRRSGDWWIIGSDVDWLATAPRPILELFGGIVPAPQHGANQMRGEVLLAAFCSDVAVVGAHGVLRIVGEGPDAATAQKAAEKGMICAIVFRMPAATASPGG